MQVKGQVNISKHYKEDILLAQKITAKGNYYKIK